jgi:glycosyltransferase involved in cell wall biosynthesis
MTAAQASTPNVDASIILPTRNRSLMLAASLPRLLDQDVGPSRYEVIVVDDGSTDMTAATVAHAGARHLVSLSQPHGGCAKARNAGIAVARGRVLVFVDDDVFVGRGFVRAHLSAHDAAAAVPAVVTGPIVTVDAVPASLRPLRRGEGYHRHPLPTCNGSVPATVVRELGGFDERFVLYAWEDEELARRLRRRGVRRRFVSAATAFHVKTPEQSMNLGYRLALEEQRGAMGALLSTTHPALDVAILTKTWPPLVWLDRALNALLGLDARLSEVRRTRDQRTPPLSPVWRWLLLQHAEIAAAARAREAARAGGGIGP